MKKKKLTNIKWNNVIANYFTAFVLFSLLTILPNLKNSTSVRIVVQLVTNAMLVISLALYVALSDRQVMESMSKTWAMFSIMIFSYVLIQFAQEFNFGMELVPFSICALVLSLLLSGKSGFFADFVVIMFCFVQSINWQSNASISSAETFYLLFGGVMEAVYVSFVLNKRARRITYVGFGFILGLVSVTCSTISYFLFTDVWQWQEYLYNVLFAFASGLIGVMLMFVIVPLFEKIFGISTVFRFSEIASSDTDLMRRLFANAPGTFNHSLTVATYVEACATAIGLNTSMARAVAYYHDVGKLKNSSYFSENQLNGVNPHDTMTPESSVNIIKSHTLNGLAIAKEYGLPKEVQSAIVEHHGTMPIKSFYLKAQKYTDGQLKYDGYCYAGPKPTSKISALLMLCDASEAALRAHGNRQNAEKIVDDIVAERLAFDQFSNCDITMKEIDIIKSTIITTFSGIKHKRVSYPDVVLTSDK